MSKITIITNNPAKPYANLKDAAELYQRLDGETSVRAIIINSREPEECKALLHELRSSRKTSLLPIFIHRKSGAKEDEAIIADGIITSLAEAEKAAADINKRLAEIKNAMFTSDRACLLMAWLYSRHGRELKPCKRWNSEQIYSYPAAETIAGETEKNRAWVEKLHEQGLLHQHRLIDRLRHCPHCSSPHLNFIDTCSNCRSINITQQPFLHCFTCGNVSSEDNFIAAEGLSCPNCHTKMRHIGVDYDRALEHFVCGDCNTSFVEPLVLAQCHRCDALNQPENLDPCNVYSYQLTEQGINAARTGTSGNNYDMPEHLNNVNPAFFTHWLDWLLELNKRYPDDSFSIIGIYLANLPDMVDKLGSRRVWEIMDEFVTRIRSFIRSIDIISQLHRHDLWLLLPETNASGCNILLNRILELQKLTRQPEGINLEFSAITYTAPEDSMEGENAKLLLARLNGSIK
ncbi:MAG: hypothetical protein CSB24_06680 [Deltaproteobacteria bacterium]|nr:MAG: hypothetical protein CSB24_06680 [Deltaproteobacteria bacterium]